MCSGFFVVLKNRTPQNDVDSRFLVILSARLTEQPTSHSGGHWSGRQRRIQSMNNIRYKPGFFVPFRKKRDSSQGDPFGGMTVLLFSALQPSSKNPASSIQHPASTSIILYPASYNLLLVPQRHDHILLCCAFCREESECDADRGGDGERDDHRHECDDGDDIRHLFDRDADDES